jgi:hypothetical protein
MPTIGTRNPASPKLNAFELEILARIKGSVQHPLPEPFGIRDITWESEFRARRGKNAKDQFVKLYFVPTSRIPDFITGVQDGREGTQCVFEETKDNHKCAHDAKEGARTSLDFGR